MFPIGYRTLKTALATPIAIMISEALHVPNFLSAGILAILCIQNTKKKSIHAAKSRFIACMLAIILSAIFFEIFGHHAYVIGLMLLLFIPLTVKLKVNAGVVSSSVILLHMFAAKEINATFILNEIIIVVVGIGVALIMNLYMPSLENDLEKYKDKIENNFQQIFEEMSTHLRDNASVWKCSALQSTGELLEKAKQLAYRDVENHLLSGDTFYYQYFLMRERQYKIIERALPIIDHLTSYEELENQKEIIAEFIEDLKDHIEAKNTALARLEKLQSMKKKFNKMPLPKTNEEFEARAAVTYFIKEIERYLQIKKSFSPKKA